MVSEREIDTMENQLSNLEFTQSVASVAEVVRAWVKSEMTHFQQHGIVHSIDVDTRKPVLYTPYTHTNKGGTIKLWHICPM